MENENTKENQGSSEVTEVTARQLTPHEVLSSGSRERELYAFYAKAEEYGYSKEEAKEMLSSFRKPKIAGGPSTIVIKGRVVEFIIQGKEGSLDAPYVTINGKELSSNARWRFAGHFDGLIRFINRLTPEDAGPNPSIVKEREEWERKKNDHLLDEIY